VTTTRLRAAVFDLDDTLIASARARTRAYRELQAEGIDPRQAASVNARWFDRYHAGQCSLAELRQGRWTELGLSPERALEIDELYRAHHREIRPRRDALRVLRRLREAGLKLVLLSNAGIDYVRDRVAASSFEPMLDGIVDIAAVDFKPHPDAFRAALDIAREPAERVAMVGDNLEADVEGALRAGFGLAVWLTRRKPHPDPRVITLRSLADVPWALLEGGLSVMPRSPYQNTIVLDSSRGAPVELLIRPRIEADDAAIIAIHNRQEAESAPLTADELREDGGQRWAALLEGGVVGYAAFHPAWWTGRPEVYAAEVRVERDHWGRGIGSQLYETIAAEVGARSGSRLLAWIRADVPEARRFAVRHGFEDTGQVIEERRLFIPEARDAGRERLQDRLRRQGIRIVTLAEIGEDEPFLREVRLLWDGGEAGPGDSQASFETWRSSVLRGAGLSPETHWVALGGAQPVGTTFLKRLGEDAAENDYTAVAPSHRGRGIAQALKLHAIAWARENGVRWFYTSSLINNTPMIAINETLGYRPGVRKHEVARTL
jgi:FMN phosphatase YigB (HAD superfamily)/GNAT superfamily N-acetyltransferase